jgi:hypothetical protein
MALVERLMHLDTDPNRDMAVHTFFAALNEVVAGRLTVNQVKNYYAMTTADNVDMDAIVADAPSGDAARAMYLNSIHSVFILAEVRAPGYDTPTGVRSKLGI